jgi:hypothetical protein
MKHFCVADKSHVGGDEKHDINFHWPYLNVCVTGQNAEKILGTRLTWLSFYSGFYS